MLWGRNKEVALIRELLRDRIPPSHMVRLYLLIGPSGIGKTAILDEVDAYVRSLGRPLMLFNLTNWSAVPESHDAHFIHEALQMVGLDKPSLMDDEGWDSYWGRLLKESAQKAPMVLFIVDGFDRLTSQKKIFLKEKIVDPLKSYMTTHDPRFVFAMEGAMPPGDLDTFWDGFQAQEFPLGPISLDSAKEWLKAADEPEEILDDMFAQTGGVPVKVKEFLHQRRESRNERIAEEVESKFLRGFNQQECHDVALAALMDVLSEGVVDYLLGEGKGKEVLEWIGKQNNIKGVMTSEGYQMDESMRESVSIWYSVRHPLAYSQTLTKVKALKMVSDDLGGSRERRLLGYLSLLNSFNNQLMKDLYGPDAAMAINYIANNPQIFEEKDGLYRIQKDYQHVGEVAAELIPKDSKEKFLKLVDESWQNRREEIFKLMEGAEKETKRQKAELEDVSKKMTDMESRLKSMSARLQAVMSLPTAGKVSANKVQENWNMAGIFFVLLGIVWLYVSVLTSHGVSFVHFAVGVFLILMGLTAPKIGKGQAAALANAPDSAPKISMEAQSAKNNLHYLKMRFAALEQQKQSLIGKMGDNKRKIDVWESHLQNPYV